MDTLGKKNIKESLDYAFTNEAKLLSELTKIVEIADGFGDSEVIFKLIEWSFSKKKNSNHI